MIIYNIGRFFDDVAVPAAVAVLLLCGGFALCAVGVYVLSLT